MSLYPQKRTLAEWSASSAERQKLVMCDYSMLVFALNLIDVWLPSQSGLFFEAPHLHGRSTNSRHVDIERLGGFESR